VAFDQLVRVLDHVPLVSSVRNDLKGLRSLLLHRRAPRIAALGMPSSGRSSLLRALIARNPIREPLHADHGAWVKIAHEAIQMDWLEIDVADDDARAEWKAALDEAIPDVVLVTLEPNNLPSAPDILARVKSLVPDVPEGTKPLRVLVLLTHADLVGDGAADVEAARAELETVVDSVGLEADPPLAVSAISGSGLEALSETLILALPEDARFEAARALVRASEARVRIGNEIVQGCTAVSVTVGLTPIPFSDMVVLGPLQAMMVSALAHLSGRNWGKKTIAEWVGSLGLVGGLGMGLRYSAQTIAKLVPGAGSVISAGVAGAGTTAMGQSAIKYFLKG
jgi:uncharacterized protein (DUF697 family)